MRKRRLNFGTYIRQHREQAGMSLRALSAAIGISAAFWSRVERELEPPPKDNWLLASAQALGIPSDEVFVAAGRLPPDMRLHLRELVSAYRQERAARPESENDPKLEGTP